MVSEDASGSRFVDRGRPLAAYSDLIHVVCPGCGGQAVVVPRLGLPELRYFSELQFRPRRLVCRGCGTTRDWVARQTRPRGGALIGVALGGPNDPFFGRPLWLQAPCCGRLLWAYNGRHVGVLRSYVAADVRERTGPTMGMFDRLPAWIKKANHRTEVLKAIDRLRNQLDRPTPADRPPSAYERPDAPGPRPVRDLYFRAPY